MAIKKVILKNVKAIKKMEFELPSSNGVYLLTGLNGCGKSSLLIALDRIKNQNAFRNLSKSNRGAKIDNIDDCQIIYFNESDNKVRYRKSNQRWASSPKKEGKLLLNSSQFKASYFISTSKQRFDIVDPNKTQLPSKSLHKVSREFAFAMSYILCDDRFNDLCYYQIDRLHGRQKALQREKKFYVLKSGSYFYSERNFSLGERLVLNALDSIEQVKDNALLLVDEIELALHPTAQECFYLYLSKIAKEKNLMVFIATHSSTLIKLSPTSKTYYLSKNNEGDVTINNSSSPAYILRDISINQDRCPDLLIFVEDIMAYTYINHIVAAFKRDQKKNVDIRVVHIGGYPQVVETTIQYFGIRPFSSNNVQAFLDNDVKTFAIPEARKNRTKDNIAFLELYDKHKDNISFLDITPELGIMDWYRNNHWKELEEGWRGTTNELDFYIPNDLKDINSRVSRSTDETDRHYAKSCMHKLINELQNRNITLKSTDDCERCIMDIYVKYRLDHDNLLKQYQEKLFYCLNRRKQ